MTKVETMLNVQRYLSRAQATPVIGPLLVSPVKAVVSTAQLIAGLVATIFLGTLSMLTFNDFLAAKTLQALGHAGLGFTGLAYSVSNFISLGIVGYRFESMAAQPAGT